MLVGLFEQLEREGQKEVENPGKGGRALKTKGIEDKVFFLLRVGEGLSSVFTKISEARGLWTYHLAYRKEGMAVWTAFPIQNSTYSHQGGAWKLQALQTDLTTGTLPCV